MTTKKIAGMPMAAPLRRFAPVLTAVLIAAHTPAYSWDSLGHRTVAVIAEHRLSPQAQAAVRNILGPKTSLADIASCADSIKFKSIRCGSFDLNYDHYSAAWHFISIPLKETPTAETLDRFCHKYGRPDNCAPAQAKLNLAVLQDPASGLYQKQVALMFLVHLIGDIHQPLHDINDNDGGGVSKPVTFFSGGWSSKKTNLHQIWNIILMTDSQIKKTRPADLAAKLEQKITPQNVRDWTQGDVITAAVLESFDIGKKKIYPDYYAGHTDLGKDYQAEMQPIAFERIEMAGVRLAYLLNETWKQ